MDKMSRHIRKLQEEVSDITQKKNRVENKAIKAMNEAIKTHL